MRDRWYELMEDYSFRSLAGETDKLPALSGLARRFQDVFPDGKYLAGIWSTHTDLLSCIASTWSWASVRGQISYETQRLTSSGGRVEDRAQEKPLDCDFGDLKVEEMYTLPKHNDIYGAIKGAYLVLSGALLAVIDSDPQFRESV